MHLIFFLLVMRNHPNNLRVVAVCNALPSINYVAIREEWHPVTILQAMRNHSQCAKMQESV
jgi:hypothetical protein